MLLGRIKNAEGKSYTTGAAKIAAAKIKHVRYGVVAECFDAMVKGKEAVYDFFDAKRSAAGGRYGASRGLLQPIDLAKIDALIQNELVGGGEEGGEKTITIAPMRALAAEAGIIVSGGTIRSAMNEFCLLYTSPSPRDS